MQRLQSAGQEVQSSHASQLASPQKCGPMNEKENDGVELPGEPLNEPPPPTSLFPETTKPNEYWPSAQSALVERLPKR